MGADSEKGPAPRIIVVMDDQWPRALLRAGLLDAGYDAIGARSVSEALTCPPLDPGRGAVRMVVVDQRVLAPEGRPLAELLRVHGDPIVLLLASAGEPIAHGPWHVVMRRPLSIGEVLRAVQSLLPLTSTAPGSVD